MMDMQMEMQCIRHNKLQVQNNGCRDFEFRTEFIDGNVAVLSFGSEENAGEHDVFHGIVLHRRLDQVEAPKEDQCRRLHPQRKLKNFAQRNDLFFVERTDCHLLLHRHSFRLNVVAC